MSQRSKRSTRQRRDEERRAAERRHRRRAWLIFGAVVIVVLGVGIAFAIVSGELGLILSAAIGLPALAGVAAAIQHRLLHGEDAEDNDLYAAGNTWIG